MGQTSRGEVTETARMRIGVSPGRRRTWRGLGIRVPKLQHILKLCILVLAACHVSWPAALAQSPDGKSLFDTVIKRNSGPGAALPDKSGGPQPAAAADASRERAEQRGGTEGGAASPKAGSSAPRSKTAEVRDVRVSAAAGKTRVEMSLSAGVRAEIFTLANPYRVIIDLPDVTFRLPDGTGQSSAGLISAFRFGLFAENKGRVVLDASGPVRIDGARMTASGADGSVALEMDLVEISAAEFGAGTGAASKAAAAPRSRPAVFDDQLGGTRGGSKKPLVVIDPGHGGIDPGAVGVDNVLEKKIVMDVAQRLQRRLKATGRYRVAMTRTRDVFVSLDQRVDMSREAGADLFISIHADSLASKAYAPVVRGATVYTLSERASDEQARLMAEKENASDQVAGIESAALAEENEQVRSILIDLMKRETSNFSTDFSNLLVARLKKSVSLSRDPQRSAAFRVLKQTHAPSVLVELGYISNEADARQMRQAEWQSKVAGAIVAAIDAFFDRRTARSGR